MKSIGLILNPMAGRDIRRLVARASLTSSTDKLQAARRVIAGVENAEAVKVFLIDDWEGMGRALQADCGEVVQLLPGDRDNRPGNPARTRVWSKALEDAGVSVLVIIGGDGTQRNAAECSPKIPILAVAGGTNNVACWLGDETVAGYAAAMWTKHQPALAETGHQAKLIHVKSERSAETLALIDVSLIRQRYTGALAVWEAREVMALLLAVADPARPGLSNVGGMVSKIAVDRDQGLFLSLNDGPSAIRVKAVLAPGLMETFHIGHIQRVALGEPIFWQAQAGGTLALDGERTIVLAPGEQACLEIRRDGPWFLHPGRILERLAHKSATHTPRGSHFAF